MMNSNGMLVVGDWLTLLLNGEHRAFPWLAEGALVLCIYVPEGQPKNREGPKHQPPIGCLHERHHSRLP